MNSIRLFLMQLMKLTTRYLKILILKQLSSELNIKPIIKKDYINLENKETIENKIYNSRKVKIEILNPMTLSWTELKTVNLNCPI